MQSIISVSGLSKTYASGFAALKNIDLDVRPGEIFALLGPNGAGKTTSFYMIVGLVRADAGEIAIDGQPVEHMPIHRRSRLGLSYLPQEASIFRKLTVAENVRAILELQDLDPDTLSNRLDALLSSVAEGDRTAFEALYQRHESRLFRYLFRQLRNQASADDVMQDVWFSVARSAQRYQPTARFTTWLFTLAHNRMIDLIRKQRPQHSLEQTGDDEDGAPLQDLLPGDARGEPERQAQSAQEGAALLAAVGRLPDDQRSAFLMQAEGDLSLEEIAAATGASFETVKSRLRYARAKLKQLLWEYA